MREFDVLAAGDLNIDLIMTGLSSLPIAGRELLADSYMLAMGGSTAICAAGLARLGLKTAFVGKVGDDFYGRICADFLSSYGVDLSNLIVDPSLQTGITVSMTATDNPDRALATYLGSIDGLLADDIPDALLSKAKHIHVGSFFLQSNLRKGLAGLFERARALGVTTSLDAGWDDSENWNDGLTDVLKHTDIFFPNEPEALAITGESGVSAAAEKLSGLCRICAVKYGAKGAVISSGGQTRHFPTYQARPIDTTGAGDSFNAGFIYGFINGLSLEESAKIGNACGSISVTRRGGASSCASLDEVRRVISEGRVQI
jgi:sugar/nucleoside kinase (ribokinase family)